MTVDQSLYYRKTWTPTPTPQTKTHKGTYPQMGSFAYYQMPKCTYGPLLSTVPSSTKPYDFHTVSITELRLFISFYHCSKYTKHFMRFMNHTQEPVALKFLLDHYLSNPLFLTLGIHPASQLTSPSGGCQPTLRFVYLLTISGIYNAEQFICPKLYFNLCSITRQSF